MKDKLFFYFKEEKNNIILFIFSIIILILLFSFTNNSKSLAVINNDMANSITLEQQKRMEKILDEKEQTLISFKERGCSLVKISGNDCNLENNSCSDLIEANSKIKCISWKTVHIERPNKLKSIYYTTYAAASVVKRTQLLNLIKNTEINSVVIDIKEVDGKVAFDMSAYEFGSIKPISNNIIKDPVKLVKELHQEGIYVIGRMTVFKDKILAERRPDLAIKTLDKKTVWTDNKGKKYLDPNNKEVWDYNLNIARVIYLVGFDEVNFDYLRFPSDGNIENTWHPFSQTEIDNDYRWGRSKIMDKFFNYLTSNLRKEFPKIILSGDLFGYTAIVNDDLKIGQILEDAILYFDVVGPMTYPSHYNQNFMGLNSADSHPYEVVKDTMKKVTEKIDRINYEIKLAKKENRKILIRPGFEADFDIKKAKKIEKDMVMIWLQGFSCTWCKPIYTLYGKEQIQAQSKAAMEQGYENWFVWNAASHYEESWFLKN